MYLTGLIHFYRNELDAAIDQFRHVLEHRYILHTRAVVDALAGRAFSYQATGRSDRADAAMTDLFAVVEALDDPAYTLIAHSARARLAIQKGDEKSAIAWAQNPATPPENMAWWIESPAVTRCRVQIAEGSAAGMKAAGKRLEELLDLNRKNHNTLQSVHIMSMLAIVYATSGRTGEALPILGKAVDLAASGGTVRPFVEMGPPMADLLNRLQKKNIAGAFIESVLDGLRDEASAPEPDTSGAEKAGAPSSGAVSPGRGTAASARPQPLVEPLTNRELDTLELLAQRLQTKEIAEKLYISTETVKSHLKNIYQKLGVNNRRQAVQKATDLGII